MGFPFIVLDIGDFHHMNHMMDWWGVPYMGFWWIGILIGLLFLIGYLVIRGKEAEAEVAIEDAQHILDERYAKGEITQKEYLQMKKDIKKGDE